MSKRPRSSTKVGKNTSSKKKSKATADFVSAKKAERKYYQSMNYEPAGFLGIEKKFYDTALVASALTAPTDAAGGEHDPSATSMISTPAQGDGPTNRDGNQILAKSVQIKGEVAWGRLTGATDFPSPESVYVALVLDTRTNGQQMNSEDCFVNTSGNATLACDVQRNLYHKNRFKILKSQRFEPRFMAGAYNGTNFDVVSEQQHFDWFVPMDMQINFNSGTTASVANCVDNSLHLIAFCDNTTRAPTLSYNARMRYLG